LGCAGLFFILPSLGLVDVRVIPQAHLFLALFTAIILAMAYENWPARDLTLMTTALVFLFIMLAHKQIYNYPHWVRWNYGGWKSKEKYNRAEEVFQFLAGNFSQNRIANEHHPDLGQTGSPRVFELMPMNAHRATMESLYVEATHTAYITTDIQGRISKSPSCPIRNVPCPTLETKSLSQKMQLIGLQDLILMTPEAIDAVNRSAGKFTKIFSNDMFKIYQLQDKVNLVEVLAYQPILIRDLDWQTAFRKWYLEYDGPKPALVMNQNSALSLADLNTEKLLNESSCSPQLQVDFDQIQLDTDCPGKWHVLKFTYHPAWQADSKDPVFLISPGFMLISPSQKHTVLRFGPQWTWRISGVVSFLVFGLWMLFFIRKYFVRMKSN
jgi:hypothetical protein